MSLLRRLRRNRRGATAMEYGLIAALVSVAATSALTAIGVDVTTLFSHASDPVAEAATVN